MFLKKYIERPEEIVSFKNLIQVLMTEQCYYMFNVRTVINMYLKYTIKPSRRKWHSGLRMLYIILLKVLLYHFTLEIGK